MLNTKLSLNDRSQRMRQGNERVSIFLPMPVDMRFYVFVFKFLCVTVSVYFHICVWLCVSEPQINRPLLPLLGSFFSYLNMPQWSSPKDHNPCQTLPAPSVLALNQGPKMAVPGPCWVAPVGLPRSSVFSSTSQLIWWGGEGWGWGAVMVVGVGLVGGLEGKTMQGREGELNKLSYNITTKAGVVAKFSVLLWR